MANGKEACIGTTPGFRRIRVVLEEAIYVGVEGKRRQASFLVSKTFCVTIVLENGLYAVSLGCRLSDREKDFLERRVMEGFQKDGLKGAGLNAKD